MLTYITYLCRNNLFKIWVLKYSTFLNIKITVFWDVTLSSSTDRYQRFGGTYSLYHQSILTTLFYTEDGGSRFFWNFGTYPSKHKASHPRRRPSYLTFLCCSHSKHRADQFWFTCVCLYHNLVYRYHRTPKSACTLCSYLRVYIWIRNKYLLVRSFSRAVDISILVYGLPKKLITKVPRAFISVCTTAQN
jgi:hypothetical protein